MALGCRQRRFASPGSTDGAPSSGDRLIDLPMSYAAQAPLYCFGLLAEIDLPDLLRLATGVPVHDLNRGPLQK